MATVNETATSTITVSAEAETVVTTTRSDCGDASTMEECHSSNSGAPNEAVSGAVTASSDTNEDKGDVVTELHPNDVLHGRGAAYDRMEGNMRFRALIKTRASAYRQADSCDKKRIAAEIVENVHANGGRFLRVIEPSSKEEDEGLTVVVSAENVVWERVSPSVALEKVKQALRDSKRQETARRNSVTSVGSSSSSHHYNHAAAAAAAAHPNMAMTNSNAAILDLLRANPGLAARNLSTSSLLHGTAALSSSNNNNNATTSLQLRQAAAALHRHGASAAALDALALRGMVQNLPSLSTADRLSRLQLLQQMQRDDQQLQRLQLLQQRKQLQQRQQLQQQQQQQQQQDQERQLERLVLQRRERLAAATRAARLRAAGVNTAKPSSSPLLGPTSASAPSAGSSTSALASVAVPGMGKTFTGQSLMAMLQAQVLAESARDVPFLLKIQSVYRTVLQHPSNHRLTTAESQSLVDAVRSVQVAIARATSSGGSGSGATGGGSARALAPSRVGASASILPPSLLNAADRVGATSTSLSARMRNDSGSSGGSLASTIVSSSSTYSKETLARRAAIMADCAPTRRKRGYLNDNSSISGTTTTTSSTNASSNGSLDERRRLQQQKRSKLS